MAFSSSSKQSRIKLLDLHPDLLLKLLRDFIFLEDKLHTLLKMPEFRNLLKYRASYLDPSAPFSFEYIRLLRHIRPGWYMARNNWSRINETTWNFSLHHFLLEFAPNMYRSIVRCDFYYGSIDHMVRKLDKFLTDYYYMEDLNVLTYHLKS